MPPDAIGAKVPGDEKNRDNENPADYVTPEQVAKIHSN